MANYCVVPGCHRFGGHVFPEDEALCLKWRVAIKREGPKKSLWVPDKTSTVCQKHFKEEDYSLPPHSVENNSDPQARRLLRPGAVPSVFPLAPALPASVTKQEEIEKEKLDEFVSAEPDFNDDIDVAEVEIATEADELPILPDEKAIQVAVQFNEKGSQTDESQEKPDPTPRILSVHWLKHNEEAIQFYTGLTSYQNLLHLLQCLGPDAQRLEYRCPALDTQDELFLCLIKLRLDKEDVELGILFGISDVAANRICQTWINFLYLHPKQLKMFLPKEMWQKI